MPLYLVESVSSPDSPSAGSPEVGQADGGVPVPIDHPGEGVTWHHRFMTADGLKMYFLVKAPSPAAIRLVAHHQAIPIERLTIVMMADDFTYMTNGFTHRTAQLEV